MSKIYNEIVIDMNPESSSYGETLHEDSFEYEGDMMLLQPPQEGDIIYVDAGGGMYQAFQFNDDGEWKQEEGVFSSEEVEGQQTFSNMSEGYSYMNETMAEWEAPTLGEMGEGYGAPSLTYEEVQGMDPDELLEWVKTNRYGGEWPGASATEQEEFGKDIKEELSLSMPHLEAVSEEKMGFLAEQYGGAGADGIMGTEDDVSFAESLAGQSAGMKKQADLYGIQKGAEMLGQQAMKGYAGGGGMRAQLRGREQLGKGFKTAQEQYGASQERAGAEYTSGVYGLEQAAESDWESNFASMISGLPTAGGG